MRLQQGMGVAAFAIGVSALSARAAVVYAHNGILLLSSSEAAYVGSSVTDSASDSKLENLQPVEPPYASLSVTSSSRIDDFRPASTSNPDTDIIQAKTLMTYTFGEGLGADSMNFSVRLGRPVGAQSALNSVGEQAAGRFVGEGRALFFVDGSYADGVFLPSGTIIGSMSLAALTGLDAFTTFSGNVMAYDASTPLGTEVVSFSSATGFAGAAIALQTGVSYEFLFRYEVLVPWGTVPSAGFAPDLGFDYSATIVAVPAPGALALVGLAGLRVRRRRG